MGLKDRKAIMKINRNSAISSEYISGPVAKAVDNLKRDLEKSCLVSPETGADIRLIIDEKQKIECFCLAENQGTLEIRAHDELGFIYGIYAVSREILGIHELWFWNDQKIKRQDNFEVSKLYCYQSMPAKIRYRGWFINDEVLLHTWSVNRRQEEPWEMAFEALLRLGGNLVIPGTDRNAVKYRGLAAGMGLYITHHHAEPLGAEMFARAYPGLTPSYEENGDKFRKLWEDGIREQKDMKVIWNIGFRGQGDCPFWDDDPRYQTHESRGRLMGDLIGIQYNMVKQMDPGAVCCTNLYGETMELYREGFLSRPDDVIKIWADNGFGKMVTRRQENHNPRICALPEEQDKGRHGIYYHVSFYDLQAANHITMLPNSPEFVCRELNEVIGRGMTDYWLINCSNIKPHVYFLDLLAEIWTNGTADIKRHREDYTKKYYGADNAGQTALSLAEYAKYAAPYGEYEDEHAGEQFSNHVARMLITQFIQDKNKRTDALLWATPAKTLREQILWYQRLCSRAADGYHDYLHACEGIAAKLTDEGRELYRDSILLQAQIHFYCFQGAYLAAKSLQTAVDGDFQRGFYLAGKARQSYIRANGCMRDREHGKWHGFYENECLTDVKQTAWVLETLMSYLRCLGDGPHYYQWQRDFLYSEKDKRVMLIMNMENHLTDLELFDLMEEKWGN